MILTEQKNATNYTINVQFKIYFKIIYTHQLSNFWHTISDSTNNVKLNNYNY